MNLLALPAFSDNYLWLLHDGRQAVVVDPGDAQPVHAALDALALDLVSILVTHHHADHIGGVEALRPRLRGPVHGPDHPALLPPVSHCADGQTVTLLGLDFHVIGVPGHTLTHVAFYAEVPDQAPVLFCGDTLFSGGCGRLFEGTPQDLSRSLQRLAHLPAATRVCCAHEYTLANLRFAQAVEPGNADLSEYVRHCQSVRDRGEATLPSSIGLERRINPFLRCESPEVVLAAMQRGAQADSPVSVLASLRQWKDGFR